MAEVTTPEKSGGKGRQPHPGISRRHFLAWMGIGAKAAVIDSFLSHIPNVPVLGLSRNFWEQFETATLGVPVEQLKKEIEDRFQIQLVSPSTGVKEVEFNNEKKYPTTEWDNPRLKSLIRVLSELPTHFYSPRIINDKEYKIRFALTEVPREEFWSSHEGKYRGGFCACLAANRQLVVLDRKVLGQTLLETNDTRENLFHEITHALTSHEITKYSRIIIEPLGVGKEGLRSLFSKEFTPKDKNSNAHTFVNAVLKSEIKAEEYIVIDNMFAVRRYFYLMLGEQFFRSALETYWQKQQEEQGSLPILPAGAVYEIGFTTGDLPSIKYKSKLGYGASNFYEFLSVAAGYYSKGRNEFVKTYEPFLGKERAEKLYEGVKREIFQGKEY